MLMGTGYRNQVLHKDYVTMKRLFRLGVLLMMAAVISPLAGCSSAHTETATEGEGAATLSPDTMKNSAAIPSSPE